VHFENRQKKEAGHAAGQEGMLVVCIETSKATFLSGSNLS